MVLFPRLNNLQAFSMLQSAHWLIFIPPSLYAFFIEARNQTSCDIFTPDTTFPSFSGHAVLSRLFHAWYGYGIDGQRTSRPYCHPAYSLKDCNPSFHYLLLHTPHDCGTASLLFHHSWKEAAQPDPAKDFDFTLNMIALRAITASWRRQTTHPSRLAEWEGCSTVQQPTTPSSSAWSQPFFLVRWDKMNSAEKKYAFTNKRPSYYHLKPNYPNSRRVIKGVSDHLIM